jgi:hypothetical protein
MGLRSFRTVIFVSGCIYLGWNIYFYKKKKKKEQRRSKETDKNSMKEKQEK